MGKSTFTKIAFVFSIRRSARHETVCWNTRGALYFDEASKCVHVEAWNDHTTHSAEETTSNVTQGASSTTKG
jgi:hypothetical protein